MRPQRRSERSARLALARTALATAMCAALSVFADRSVSADPLSPDDCLDYGVDETVRYRCGSPATVAFCMLSHAMKPGATQTERALARSLSCTPSDRMHDPCAMRGPGRCDSARRRARTLGIADMDALWGLCEGVDALPRYEGRGRFGCAATAAGETAPTTPAAAEVARGEALSGDEVRKVQASLAGLGYAPGPVDGLWGPRTANAWRRFAVDAALPVTEVPTARALRALRDAAPSRAEIREAQALLAAMGYAPGPVDGLWGPRTLRAARTFLADAGLPVEPVVPASALRALRAVPPSGREAGARAPPGAEDPALSARGQAPGDAREGSMAAAPPQPLCADRAHPSRCWMEFSDPARCYMWLESTHPIVTVLAVTWSGRCRDGRASGPGERQTRYSVRSAGSGATESEVRDRGSFVDGKAQGRWLGVHAASGTQFRVDYVDGEVRREEVHDTRRGTCTVSAFDASGKLVESGDC